MASTQDNANMHIGFKTARLGEPLKGQTNAAIEYLKELEDECQSASKNEVMNKDNLLEQLDINSLDLLEQALQREDVYATLGKTSHDSNDADLFKASMMQFQGRDNKVASHLESGR